MKKCLFILIAAGSSLLFTYPPAFTIEASIKGNVEGRKVYLKYADVSSEILDSTTIRNGKLVFKGQLTSPRFLSLVFKEPAEPNKRVESKVLNLFVDNTPVTVSAVYDSLKNEYEIYGGVLTSPAVIKGSASHDQFMKFYGKKSSFDSERMRLFNEYIAFLNPGKDVKKKPRQVGIDLARKMDVVEAQRKEYVLNFIRDNKPSEVLAFVAKQAIGLSSITTSDIDVLLKKFAASKEEGLLKADFVKAATLAKKTAVGSDLSNFTLADTDGKEHQLSEFIGKGKYVLLEFWASWCGPCRADIPHIKEAYAIYNKKGFDIVSISLDDDKGKWLKAVEEEDLKSRWTQLVDLKAFKGELAKTYRINGIPSCLLFDPNGKLVTRNMRGSWMDGRLIDLYGDHFDTHK